jgi:putative ubiquitin-RnfH superfamily antitoxin RatB of RatAB toxin-antitoxin module
VPRGAHSELQLQAGDRVEIVHALGGGSKKRASRRRLFK